MKFESNEEEQMNKEGHEERQRLGESVPKTPLQPHTSSTHLPRRSSAPSPTNGNEPQILKATRHVWHDTASSQETQETHETPFGEFAGDAGMGWMMDSRDPDGSWSSDPGNLGIVVTCCHVMSQMFTNVHKCSSVYDQFMISSWSVHDQFMISSWWFYLNYLEFVWICSLHWGRCNE